MIKYPDYDNSILSVISSILKYYGYDNGHKTLEVLDKKLQKDYDNILLMLFDGMGYYTLKEYLESDKFLIKNLSGPISSVCPSTTACAIPTIESGMSPIEHGWLGWSMYFKDYDANICVLKNTYEDTGKKIKGENIARKYVGYENVFNKIEKVTNGEVKAHDISLYSDTNEFVYSYNQMLRKITQIANNREKNFIYAYSEEPDIIMHSTGVDHEYVKENIRFLNSMVHELSQKLENTLIVIIADHGLVDSKVEYLNKYPKLEKMLIRKPSFESRAVNFFVKEEYVQEFKVEFEKVFMDKFILLTKKEVLEKNLFGKGNKNAHIDEFLGDYIAFAISDVALEWENKNKKITARHAGLTKEEMTVPLIIIDTKECKN